MKKQLTLLYLVGFIVLFQQSTCRMLDEADPPSEGKVSYPPPLQLVESPPPPPSELQTPRAPPPPYEGRFVDKPRSAPPPPISGKQSRP